MGYQDDGLFVTEVSALYDLYDLIPIALSKAKVNSEVFFVDGQVDFLLSRVESDFDSQIFSY